MIRINIISSESGDWEALYVNGELKEESHSICISDVIDALRDVCQITYETTTIPDEIAEEGMPVSLDDIRIK